MNFVSPEKIITQAEIEKGDHVVDFGAGAGFYTLAASQYVGDNGKVYAIDMLDSRLTVIASSAREKKMMNVEVVKADLEKPLLYPEKLSLDLVIMGNIVHQIKDLDVLIRSAYALLKTEGKLLVVEWKTDYSPFGPSPKNRIHEDSMITHITGYHFKPYKNLKADGYHYALMFQK